MDAWPSDISTRAGDCRRHPGDHRDLRRRGRHRHGELRDRAAGRGRDGAAHAGAGRRRLSLSRRGARRRASSATPMPGPTGRGRPTATRSRIRSISPPDARGQGIGGALLRPLIDECAARGFRQMIAVIGDSGNVASIRLHKAAGFALVGHAQGRRLQARALAGQRPDAARARRRARARPPDALTQATTSRSRPVDDAEHVGEVVAALEDQRRSRRPANRRPGGGPASAA